ncbi:uncharacterized protein V1518DRAFT_411086 [Limtongia smithiae]|uniref:uncharacterized protein n=1 Tax=Limtongia smithiae TaxID=1125753 RepID=UPI0034CD2A2C
MPSVTMPRTRLPKSVATVESDSSADDSGNTATKNINRPKGHSNDENSSAEDSDVDNTNVVGNVLDGARRFRINRAQSQKQKELGAKQPRRKAAKTAAKTVNAKTKAEAAAAKEAESKKQAPKRKRAAPQRKPIVNPPPESDSGGSEPISESDSSNDSYDDQDATPPFKRRGRMPKAASANTMGRVKNSKSTNTMRKRASNATIDSSETSSKEITENLLFEAVKDPDTALPDIAIDWIHSYEKDKTAALQEMVNFIIQCCGSNLTVTAYDVEDQDSAAQTLAQIQEVFGKTQGAEYPLASKKPEFKGFRVNLLKFFGEVVSKSADRELLYNDPSLMESLRIWITAMSSSTLRPFRHTSTTIGLCILTRLCEIAAKIAKTTGSATKLLEKENEKARPVKDKVQKLQGTVDDYAQKMEVIDEIMHDIFDTIFVHRYRDIDFKIRTECMRELGKWMETFPDTFFEGQYLRYMGWMLSDAQAATRLAVIKGLGKLYGDSYYIGGLRQFTERFRPRLIEIALQDVDHSVRIAAVGLLESVRAVGFLEQEDIDEVCGLCFDTNPHVRKAAAGFFLSSVREASSEILGELGSESEVRDHLARDEDEIENQEDSEESPREINSHSKIHKSWFLLKTIVESFESFNDTGSIGNPIKLSKLEAYISGSTESRFSIAAQSLWEQLPSMPDWTQIVDYALYDHSVSADLDDDSITNRIRKCISLTTQQEHIILEIVTGAVRAAMAILEAPLDRRMKVVAAERAELVDEMTGKLIALMPRLMAKFSADPDTARNVIRLHNIINLDGYTRLRQKITYETVLHKFAEYFMTFNDAALIREFAYAAAAGLKCEYLSDTVDTVTHDLLDDLVVQFRHIMNDVPDLDTALLSEETISKTYVILSKLVHLAPVVDISEPVDNTTAESCCTLLGRSSLNRESEIVVLIEVTSLLRYYSMWTIKKSMDSHIALDNVNLLHNIISNFSDILQLSDVNKNLRLMACLAIIDVVTSLNIYDRQEGANVDGLALTLSAANQKAVMKMFVTDEKVYGKLIGAKLLTKARKLKDGGADDAEADAEEGGSDKSDDDEEENEDMEINEEETPGDEGVVGQDVVTQKVLQKMKAELELCELAGKIVVGIIGSSIDKKHAARLVLNARALGPALERIVKELAPLLAVTATK